MLHSRKHARTKKTKIIFQAVQKRSDARRAKSSAGARHAVPLQHAAKTHDKHTAAAGLFMRTSKFIGLTNQGACAILQKHYFMNTFKGAGRDNDLCNLHNFNSLKRARQYTDEGRRRKG
jgi:hypothetical protein